MTVQIRIGLHNQLIHLKHLLKLIEEYFMSQSKQNPTQEQIGEFVDRQLQPRKESNRPLSEFEKELLEQMKTAKSLEEIMSLIKQAPEL